ncbi:MAG: L-serine ammonia-lyase, iron-sulfur-dependent, subunit alpha, partial [Proteobacteria bacterium]|nr:L-serine ammonia-lyase, iron-sulfur-dependent, subunit alpha [Pseudomonadota bacterium]
MPYTAKEILTLQVAPALGCTEPVAVALAAAAAAALLPGTGFTSLRVRVDPNVYKNGLAVSIPGTAGLLGLDTAAALGALGGDPAARLEVLASLNEAVVREASAALTARKVTVDILREVKGLHIEVEVTRGTDTAQCVITRLHDNIVSLSINGEAQLNHPLLSAVAEDGGDSLLAMEQWLKERTLSELLALTDDLDEDDFDFLRQGVEHNLALAEYGLKHGPGLGIGKGLERMIRQGLLTNDMSLAARMLTSAASDARMAGVNLPAMSSAGSGNHGLTAILPILAVMDYVAAG